eukprot:358637-Chlamydomonas_euryale.AAC.5
MKPHVLERFLATVAMAGRAATGRVAAERNAMPDTSRVLAMRDAIFSDDAAGERGTNSTNTVTRTPDAHAQLTPRRSQAAQRSGVVESSAIAFSRSSLVCIGRTRRSISGAFKRLRTKPSSFRTGPRSPLRTSPPCTDKPACFRSRASAARGTLAVSMHGLNDACEPCTGSGLVRVPTPSRPLSRALPPALPSPLNLRPRFVSWRRVGASRAGMPDGSRGGGGAGGCAGSDTALAPGVAAQATHE